MEKFSGGDSISCMLSKLLSHSLLILTVTMISLNGSVPATPEGQTASICVVIGLAAPLKTNVTVMLSSGELIN